MMWEPSKTGMFQRYQLEATMMNTQIAGIRPREILDHRGNPAVEVDVCLRSGVVGRASAASSASGASAPAGPTQTDRQPNPIAPSALVGMDAGHQEAIDRALDPIGAGSDPAPWDRAVALASSIAVARAGAASHGYPLWQYLGDPARACLPVPLITLLHGGAWRGQREPGSREYMIVPYGALSVRETLDWSREIARALQQCLKGERREGRFDDRGGFYSLNHPNRLSLDLLVRAIEGAGYSAGTDVGIGIDVAATALYVGERYHFMREATALQSAELVEWYRGFVSEYPIRVIVDGMAAQDTAGWQALTAALGDRTLLVRTIDTHASPGLIGDDSAEAPVMNAVQIDPVRAGTITGFVTTIARAQEYGYRTLLATGPGHATDPFLADLAVGLGARLIRLGAFHQGLQSEIANQLLRIEEEMDGMNRFAGREAILV